MPSEALNQRVLDDVNLQEVSTIRTSSQILKSNFCHISLIALTIISVLLVLASILMFVVGLEVPFLLYISIAVIGLSLALLFSSCLYLYKSSKMIGLIPVVVKDDVKNAVTCIIKDHYGFILKQHDINDGKVLKELGIKHSQVVDEYCLCLEHQADPYHIYKLSYACRNDRYTKSTTKVRDYYKSYLIAKKVCKDNNLNMLKMPKIDWNPFNSNIPDLVYDLTIEDKVPFSFDLETQKYLYKEPSQQAINIVKQLTRFICLTGSSNIDFHHIAINPDNNKEAYLLNLDIDDIVTKERIEDGLFGTKSKKGLLNCLGSEILINILLKEARSMGIDIKSDRAIRSKQKRIHHLNILDKLESLYQDPHINKVSEEVLEIKEIDVDESFILDTIPTHSFQWLSSNLNEVFFNKDVFDELHFKTKEQLTSSSSELNKYSKIKILDDDKHVYLSFYNNMNIFLEDPSEIKNEIRLINQRVKAIYKRYIRLHKLIKEKELNYITIPKVKLLNFNKGEYTYCLLASENISTINEDSLSEDYLYNIIYPLEDSRHAAMELVQLNSIEGININPGTIHRLTDPNYKLVLQNMNPSSSIDGLLGDPDSLYSGILSFADSETTLDELLLESAKYGVLDKQLSIEKKNTLLGRINDHLRLLDFYDNYNIKDKLIKIEPEDLADYLNLDLVANVENIAYFANKNIKQMSMKNLINQFIEDLNTCLKYDLLVPSRKYYSPAVKRFVNVALNSGHAFAHYRKIYFDMYTDQDHESPEHKISFLDLIREALIAKGIAYPDPLSTHSRFSEKCLALHI